MIIKNIPLMLHGSLRIYKEELQVLHQSVWVSIGMVVGIRTKLIDRKG